MKMLLMADLHIGLPETQFPGQHYEYVPDFVRAYLPTLVAENADEVIVVGDLVNRGTPGEFAAARELFAPLADRMRVIPGNHDLVRATLDDFRGGVPGARVNEVHDAGPFVQVFLNTAIEKLNPWHWHGELTADAVAAIDRAIATAAGRPMLVFAHHPPAETVRTAEHPMMVLRDSRALMDRLLAYGAPVVLVVGHNHLGDVWRTRNLTIVSLPSIAFWPHAYVVATFADGVLSFETKRLVNDLSQSPDTTAPDAATRRLREPTVERIAIRL
ncbi:MAG: metallophosphoesterase [Tepidisphaeraceae bacterium]